MDHIHTSSGGATKALCAAAALLLVAADTASGQCFHLAPPVEYPVNGSMDVVNVDGDKDIDILVAVADDVNVMRNDGTGVFTIETLVADVGALGGIAGGDVNGDGLVDVVVGIQSSGLGVLLNLGGGAYGPLTVYGTTYVWPRLADFDGDGDLDVYSDVSGGLKTAGLTVWLNNGSGAFGDPVLYPSLGDDALVEIVAADLNGDSNPDAVAANFEDEGPPVQVFINNGDATFAKPTGLALGFGAARSVVAADMDGDGDNDLVVGRGDTKIRTFINAGDGTFAPLPDVNVSAWPQCVAAADFDEDGDQDVAVGTALGFTFAAMSVLVNAGDGNLDSGGESASARWSPITIRTADFSGDGLADIALLGGGYVAIFINVTAGPRTDIVPDGVINSTDVSEFINMYFEDLAKGTLTADFDGNGITNSTDVSTFINTWFQEQLQGC